MVVEVKNGFGLALSTGRTVTGLETSSTPLVTSETKSAETSACPPLQVPLSYANRSTVTLATSSGLTPGRLVLTSSCRLTV